MNIVIFCCINFCTCAAVICRIFCVVMKMTRDVVQIVKEARNIFCQMLIDLR